LLSVYFQQVDNPAPTVSRSGKPIDLLQSSPISLIDHHAPSLAALAHRNVRFKKTTTKRPKASPSVAAATLAQAFKVKPLNFLYLHLISSHTHVILSGYIDCHGNFTGNFYLSTKFHQYSFMLLLMKSWLL
jgi:hypothetical protein